LVIGIVTNNDDPDKLGRVKVKFPSLTDGDESAWAKVLSPGGGQRRGIQCTPEVHDEVLVGFEHDDTRRPIVLGGLWNRNDPPPEEVVEGGVVVRRTWTSRDGHRIEIADETSGGVLTAALKDDTSSFRIQPNETLLDAENVATIRSKKIVLKADTTIVLDAASIEIKGSGQVTMKGSPVRIN
jgi:uncharacterized protein involved in type VI secretion and phage assembly